MSQKGLVIEKSDPRLFNQLKKIIKSFQKIDLPAKMVCMNCGKILTISELSLANPMTTIACERGE